MKRIDLNSDMGEQPELIANGVQEELLRYVTSANVACGGHAGDDATMRATVEQALHAGVAIGAHPGYEDREHFGRRELSLSAEEIAAQVHRQLKRLEKIAAGSGAIVSFVKPHGALYNQAVANRDVARAIADGVALWRTGVPLVGLAGPAGRTMLDEFHAAGFETAAEAFADRRYEPDGRLRSRRHADALLGDPAEAAAQALRVTRGEGVIAADGTIVAIEAQTLCIHSDTPGATEIARAVREALKRSGFNAQALAS